MRPVRRDVRRVELGHVRVEHPVNPLLLDVREQVGVQGQPDPHSGEPGVRDRVVGLQQGVRGRQLAVGPFVVVDRQPELVQVVAALALGRRVPDLLDGREEQRPAPFETTRRR
jgi:hypothetical protein